MREYSNRYDCGGCEVIVRTKEIAPGDVFEHHVEITDIFNSPRTQQLKLNDAALTVLTEGLYRTMERRREEKGL